MIEWINFTFFLFSIAAFSVLYIRSLQPMQRSKKRGENAWKECKNLRILASFFELTGSISIIIWYWHQLPILDGIINHEWMPRIILSLIILIPCIIVMFVGIKDAGSEALNPSKETEMYQGIYKYIRHPQTLGEFPMFIAMGILANSWFLVVFFIIWCVVYIPIMIYYEEKDLVLRFGDSYKEYQKKTGALFPKLKKLKIKDQNNKKNEI